MRSLLGRLHLALPEDADKRYRFILRIILLGAILFTVAGHAPHPHVPEWLRGPIELLWESFASIGEALFVSLIIAVLVEPVIRKHFARSLGNDLWWVLSSSEAPDEFRKAVKTLASLKRYYISCTWHLDFRWEERTRDVLRVEISALSYGVNLDAAPYRPPTHLWLMPSAPGYESHYESWEFEVGARALHQQLDRDRLESLRTEQRLWEDILKPGLEARPGEHFKFSKKSVVYPREPLIPLIHANTALRQEFRFSGPALSDLLIDLRHSGALPQEDLIKPDEQVIDADRAEITRVYETITFPGQVTLVAWSMTPEAMQESYEESARIRDHTQGP